MGTMEKTKIKTKTMDKYNEIQNIKAAILRGDSEYNGVKLPTRQTTGTSVQIDTYAQLQAQKFYDRWAIN